MKSVRWKRFTWQLAQLPPLDSPLPPRYSVRPAESGEEKVIHDVIFSALSLDSTWGDALRIFRARLEYDLNALFQHAEVPALVLCHGTRIIGASAITPFEDSENHLLSGPCVVMEYHNRGLGTALLHSSLQQLQTTGLAKAHGITKQNSVSGKFLYRKFASSCIDTDFEPAVPIPAPTKS